MTDLNLFAITSIAFLVYLLWILSIHSASQSHDRELLRMDIRHRADAVCTLFEEGALIRLVAYTDHERLRVIAEGEVEGRPFELTYDAKARTSLRGVPLRLISALGVDVDTATDVTEEVANLSQGQRGVFVTKIPAGEGLCIGIRRRFDSKPIGIYDRRGQLV